MRGRREKQCVTARQTCDRDEESWEKKGLRKNGDDGGFKKRETDRDKKEKQRGGGAHISHLLKTQCLKQVITHLCHVPLNA